MDRLTSYLKEIPLVMFASSLVLADSASADPVSDVTATVCAVGCDFLTIREAVNAADRGAVILVGPGLYVENVSAVFKRDITIRGSGETLTILDGAASGDGVRIIASTVR